MFDLDGPVLLMPQLVDSPNAFRIAVVLPATLRALDLKLLLPLSETSTETIGP